MLDSLVGRSERNWSTSYDITSYDLRQIQGAEKGSHSPYD